MPFDGLGESRGVLDILLDARDRLSDRRNWTRFAFRRSNGARCLVQVLCDTANSGRYPPLCETNQALFAAGQELLRSMNRMDRYMSAVWAINPADILDRLISFNDSPLTRHRRVLKLLDRTIARLQEQAAYKMSIAA